MSVENQYQYDEPLGLYGHESHERLAKGAISASVRYANAVLDLEPSDNFNYAETPTIAAKEVHLGTIVESRDAYFGYALAASLGETAVIGVYCLVKRDGDPKIKGQPKALEIARPETYDSNQDYKEEVEKLRLSLDKAELEVILRILNKVAVSLEISHELRTYDTDTFKKLGVAERRIKEEQIKTDVATYRKLSAAEPFTVYALSNNSRAESDPQAGQPEPVEIQHISEWTEFMDASTNLIKRETDAEHAVSHVNLQHEVDNKMYYVKLIANYGQLSHAQILCVDQADAWQSQFFEIDSDKDEDGAGLNIVSQIWDDRQAIVASLREGEIIDNDIYEEYRSMAETSLKKILQESVKPVHLRGIKKRPAA